jgi:DNA-binding beta-propeller fold protein YncE
LFQPARKWVGTALLIGVGTATAAQSKGQPVGCNAPLASPSVTIALPLSPFAVKPSADGCWVFVSLNGVVNGGIAVLKRQSGRIEMVRVVRAAPGCVVTKEYCPSPAGIALTHDGKLLVAAATTSVMILDVGRMTAGAENPILGAFRSPQETFNGSVYVDVTADDRLLFVSQEGASFITVIDLERARANRFKADAIIGNIPVGVAPIALTFSRDGKSLYTTSELASPSWNWPKACKPERAQQTGAVPANPEGAVVVVDVALARTDPANAVVSRIPAGCSAVRMAMSPDGRRVYVTARNSNTVEVFDTAKLVSDPGHSRLGVSPVGEAPVPVVVIDGGKKVVIGNSNRFAGGNGPQTLSLLDAAKMEQGLDSALGTIPSGAFPRELSVSVDGHTLFLTNAASNSLQVMDIDRLPVEPVRKP